MFISFHDYLSALKETIKEKTNHYFQGEDSGNFPTFFHLFPLLFIP